MSEVNGQQAERERIRAKLSDTDRQFLDAMRELFPNCRMVGIVFKDGEKLGKYDD